MVAYNVGLFCSRYASNISTSLSAPSLASTRNCLHLKNHSKSLIIDSIKYIKVHIMISDVQKQISTVTLLELNEASSGTPVDHNPNEGVTK